MGFWSNVFGTNQQNTAAPTPQNTAAQADALMQQPADNIGRTTDVSEHTRTLGNGQTVPVAAHTRKLDEKTAEATPTPRTAQADGTKVLLGQGFASSQGLRDRGFNDAFVNRSKVALETNLDLLADEYRAHLQYRIEEVKFKQRNYIQGMMPQMGISYTFDKMVDTVIEQYTDRIDDLKTELEDEDTFNRTVTALRNAYQKGYIEALHTKGSNTWTYRVLDSKNYEEFKED